MAKTVRPFLGIFSCLLCFFLCACAASPDAFSSHEEAPPPSAEEFVPPEAEVSLSTAEEEIAREILSSMSLEEKVGQLFFVRCSGDTMAEDITNYFPGGVLLFENDFKDNRGNWLSAEDLCGKLRSYQDAAALPLLIGVDEEGGTVARASRNPNLFEEKRPSPQEIYARGGMAAIGEDALYYNTMLLEYGINVNFAPVADLSSDPKDFIYKRTLGQDARTTADYVKTVVEQMNRCRPFGESRRMGSVLKHFPGYGNNVDTHTGIAVDERPYGQFLEEDFLPFQAGITAGAGSVLMSHTIVTCMDTDLPASLSPTVHTVLREELNFEGVILTDDLAMDALKSYSEDGTVAPLAVLAGNDMLVTTDYRTQIPQVIAAVEDGSIPSGIIDAAVERILLWKLQLGLIDREKGGAEP